MKLYDNHDAQYRSVAAQSDSLTRTFKNNTAILNEWRELKTMEPLLAFIRHWKNGNWLTVGDGVFGQDAARLVRLGVTNVHATDLVDDLLEQSHGAGFIPAYSAQNAESMTFTDNSFDIVFCKNSYHHFPRPVLAIYEMLRVSRHGVVFVEPPDPSSLFSLRGFLQQLFGKSTHEFEEVGNYVYTTSTREFEKLLLGIGLRCYAFRYTNDVYAKRIETTPAVGGNMRDKSFRSAIKLKRIVRNIVSNIRLVSPNCLLTVLFKTEPSGEEIAVLKRHGFRVRTLPQNPYK